jgi:ATP-dependent DNA helicase RecG
MPPDIMADELGSGIRNTFKYMDGYVSGAQPVFVEDDIFKTIIPLKTEIDKKWGEKWGENGVKTGDKWVEDEQKMIKKVRRRF